jgi:large subunit ribosomal protein L25
MDTMTLQGEARETGTRSARAVRREGNVPCILYGHHDEPIAFKVPELELHPLIYTDETHVVTVSVGDKTFDCIMKEVEFHPVTDRPIHADFQILTAGETITMTVPIQYHGTPVGQTEGGDTQVILNELTIKCLPKDIPGHIDVDITHLQIGDSIHVSDLDAEEYEVLNPDRQTLVTVVPPRLVEEETEEDELLEADAELGEEGEAEGEESEESEENEA